MSEQFSGEDAEAYKLLLDQTREALLRYIQTWKEVSVIPLPGGRAAKVEIMGRFPVNDDDISLIIMHLQLMKRSKVFSSNNPPGEAPK